MNTSVLGLVQEFADTMSLPTPTALIGAQDKSTKQYRALMMTTLRDLSEYRWPEQRLRMSFTTVAAELQGELTTLFGAGYKGLMRDTMWNDTRHMRIMGPVPDQVWNALQTLPNAGPEFLMYISRGNLYVSPAAVAGESISAIVVTNYNVIVAGTPSTYAMVLANDTDALVFPDNVVLKWFKYLWRKQKGEAGWENDYGDALALVSKNIVKEGGERLTLSPNIDAFGPRPGIIIPPGNWPAM